MTVSLLAALLAQAIGDMPSTDFDLAKFKPRPVECGSAGLGGEIVVCGRRRPEPPWLAPRAGKAALPPAEIKLLGDMSVGVEAVQRDTPAFAGEQTLPGGFPPSLQKLHPGPNPVYRGRI